MTLLTAARLFLVSSSLFISCHLSRLYQLLIRLLSPGITPDSGRFSPTSESYVSPAAESRWRLFSSCRVVALLWLETHSDVFFFFPILFLLPIWICRGSWGIFCLMEGVGLLQACWCLCAAQRANVWPTFAVALNISIDGPKWSCKLRSTTFFFYKSRFHLYFPADSMWQQLWWTRKRGSTIALAFRIEKKNTL